MVTYDDYFEARESLWNSLSEQTKIEISAVKEQTLRRKQIAEQARNDKTSWFYYWQKYDELCKLEKEAGLTDLAKAFCEFQAKKYLNKNRC